MPRLDKILLGFSLLFFGGVSLGALLGNRLCNEFIGFVGQLIGVVFLYSIIGILVLLCIALGLVFILGIRPK